MSWYTDNKNFREIEILNYDQVKIDAMQNNPLTIGLKSKIEINPEDDKFVISFQRKVGKRRGNILKKLLLIVDKEHYENVLFVW